MIALYRDENGSEKSYKSLIRDSFNYQTNITSFIRRIQTTYPKYQDLVNIFLIGVSILLKGLKNATFYVQKQKFLFSKLQIQSTLEMNSIFKIIGNYCNTNSPAFIANYLFNSETINKLSKLSNASKINFESNISILLRSALLEIQNEMQFNSRDILQKISFRILNVFVKCWKNLREKEELERLEEESLFSIQNEISRIRVV